MRLHSCITWSSALDKAHCSSVSCQAIMDMPNVVCRPAHKFTPSLTHILLVRTVTCKALVRIGSTMQPRAWPYMVRSAVQCVKHSGVSRLLLDVPPLCCRRSGSSWQCLWRVSAQNGGSTGRYASAANELLGQPASQWQWTSPRRAGITIVL